MTERLHTGILYADGSEALACPRLPDQVGFELWANDRGLDLSDRRATAMTSLTYQAWHALRRTGNTVGKFEAWADTVDEVYPASPRGERLTTDKDGKLAYPDGSPWFTEQPDPTRPDPASGK